MSEFLVKMDTPNRCCDCPMCYDYILCRLAGKEFGEIECVEIVADWCPLIKIPPHGRLIDETDVIKHFVELANDPWNQNVCTSWSNAFAEAAGDICDMPTIIEAEEW